MKADSVNKAPGNLTGHDCPKCLNRGYIAIPKEDGNISSRDCDCMRIRQCVWEMEKSGLKNIIREKTFDTYIAAEEWQKAIKAGATAYADNPDRWLLFCGQPGSGKTHLCTAVCRHRLLAGDEVRYMPWRDKIAEIKAMAMDNENRTKILQSFKTAQILYIDDLYKVGRAADGSSNPTGADVGIAFEIINHRKNGKADVPADAPQQAAPGADITQPAAAQPQSPQSVLDDLIDEAIARATNAPANPLSTAVEGYQATGSVTNKQAQDILNNSRAITSLLQQTGIKLPDTASGRRNAVKEAVAQLAQQPQSSPQADVLPGSEINTSEQNAPATEAPTAQLQTYTDELLDELIPAKSAHDVGKTEGRKRSKVYTNTYKNATGEAVQSIGQAAQQLEPNIANYDPITEKESLKRFCVSSKMRK